MQTIGDIIGLNARRYPDKTALVMENEFLSFHQLNQQTNQLAHGLLSLGVKPGDKVAIFAENCLEWVIVNLAIVKCGGVAVPLNFRYKKDELIYAINNSETSVLFFGAEFFSIIEEAKDEFASMVKLVAMYGETLESKLSLKSLMDGRSTSEPAVRVDPTWPAAIMYTSGTTGSPKGVLTSHSGFFGIYIGLIVEGDVHHDDVTMVSLPLFHGGGMHSLVLPQLLMGSTSVIMGRGFDPDKVLDTVTRYGVTLTMWVPTQLAMLVNYPGLAKHDVTTLKKIWYGSSPITPTVLESSRDFFKVGFYQFYGQTETGMVSVLRPEDHLERSQCTGREMFNANLRVVNEDGRDIQVDEVGEIICAQAAHGMIGYYKMEEATKETIRDGWIYTGDLARAEGNGYFNIADRATDMIISGAENIYPKEIENVISSHDGILEVAVFGIPDEIYGESVCAAVIKKDGYEMDEQVVIDFCASKISSYKKPKHVIFLEELPKNSLGKVTKNVLRDPYWAGKKKKV
jgi:fatty-acyl-CoA synthase